MAMLELKDSIRIGGIKFSLMEQDFETHQEAKDRAKHLRSLGVRCRVKKIQQSTWWEERYPLYINVDDWDKYSDAVIEEDRIQKETRRQ